jgi:hypothetical protein
MLYRIIKAGKEFEKINRKIGDVSSINIFLKESGQLLIISTISMPEELDNYQKYLKDKDHLYFIAPEEMNKEFLEQEE